MRITQIGGPTALIEYNGLRFLTDPTFDPAGGDYVAGPVTLHKKTGPALDLDDLSFDIVLLSHDHHFDNLDHQGRTALARAGTVLTTVAGAERLGGNAQGLGPWASVELDGIRVTGTPARHGPAHADRGPVTGFVLSAPGQPDVYVSGDTVWYDGVAEVASRFDIRVALLFMGAASVPEVGPWHITMTAQEGVQFARAFPHSVIVPVHCEGWRHFTESCEEIAKAFSDAGLADRLKWARPGDAIDL